MIQKSNFGKNSKLYFEKRSGFTAFVFQNNTFSFWILNWKEYLQYLELKSLNWSLQFFYLNSTLAHTEIYINIARGKPRYLTDSLKWNQFIFRIKWLPAWLVVICSTNKKVVALSGRQKKQTMKQKTKSVSTRNFIATYETDKINRGSIIFNINNWS